jgi:hypothetical protein
MTVAKGMPVSVDPGGAMPRGVSTAAPHSRAAGPARGQLSEDARRAGERPRKKEILKLAATKPRSTVESTKAPEKQAKTKLNEAEIVGSASRMRRDHSPESRDLCLLFARKAKRGLFSEKRSRHVTDSKWKMVFPKASKPSGC